MLCARFLAAGLFAAAVLRGQDPAGLDPVQALEKMESARSEEIPPEVRAAIIDKPRIAEQTLGRLQGLREAGNPHIQRGEGLLLPAMKEDPAVARVNLEKLHEEQVALIEGRGPAAGANGRTQAPARAMTFAAAPPSSVAPRPQGGWGGLLFASCCLFLTVAGLFYVWRQSRG